MNTQETHMNPEQSLSLINEMIGKAKQSYNRTSIYFLIWGWLLIAAGLGEYYLGQIAYYNHPYIVWPIMGVVGGILSIAFGKRESARSGIHTYTDKLFSYLWGGFMATLIIVIVASISQRVNPGPFIIILTGLPTFVSGGITRFKPLIVGGIVFWVLGLITFFLPMEYSSLMFAFAIFCGYIIPGYMLKSAERNG